MIPLRKDRPDIPPGYGVDEGTGGLAEWAGVATTIDSAELYWVATQLPNGSPHLIPIHAAGLNGIIHLSGDPETRWARNLAASPAMQVGIDHQGKQVMVRGKARLETPTADTFAAVKNNIASKYDWQLGDEPIPMWIVEPTTVLAFEPAEFASSPTRFTFKESE